jgi:hypothetical protein
MTWLGDGIQAARQVFPFDLWAWVFMPQHVLPQIERCRLGARASMVTQTAA